MGVRWGALIVVSAAALATACGSNSAPMSGDTGSAAATSGAPVKTDPLALWGSWRVEGAAGEEPGAVLQLGAAWPPVRGPEPHGHRLMLWRHCGQLLGGWKTNSAGMFVGVVDGRSAKCADRDDPARWTPAGWTPDWLRRAVGYRMDAGGPVLLDANGDSVARLLAGGRPTPGPDIMPEMAEPPILDDRTRRELNQPEGAPPGGLVPTTPAQLYGRWFRADAGGSRATNAFLELSSDGSWQISRCDPSAGRWISDESGRFLAVPSGGAEAAGLGCRSKATPGGLIDASYAFFDGQILVLLDSGGNEVGRLAR
jgi:hypothetical protein